MCVVKNVVRACVDGRLLEAMQGVHACVGQSMQAHARRSKSAISLRICADASPEVQSLDKNFQLADRRRETSLPCTFRCVRHAGPTVAFFIASKTAQKK
ncbi:hypothetical protein ACFQS6_16295 [Xanthomonas populi]